LEDMRKVKTAVLGGPRSQEPIVMPMDYSQAKRFSLVYASSHFFCGSFLGGCGRELSKKIGEGKRVPHFAHISELSGRQSICNRRNTGRESADHLYLGRALPRWLKRDGGVRYEGSIPGHGGICDGLTVQLDSGLLVVALTDAMTGGYNGWEEEDERLTKMYGHVEWLFGTGTSVHNQVMTRRGYALRVECRDDTRDIHIGTQFGPSPDDVRWSPLSACTYRENVLWTPHLDHARAIHTQRQRQKNVIAAKTLPEDYAAGAVFQELKELMRELSGLSPTPENLEAADRLIERSWSAHDRLRPGANRDWVRKSLESHEARFARGSLTADKLDQLRQKLRNQERQKREKRVRRDRERWEQERSELGNAQKLKADEAAAARDRYMRVEFERAVTLLKTRKVYDKETRILIARAEHAEEMLTEKSGTEGVLDAHVQRLMSVENHAAFPD
jgi:hypothetical protein